jgi:hypothetical protein
VSVEHIGVPDRELAAILDAHLPASADWRVVWHGDAASVRLDGGCFTIESGRVWGPYNTTGPLPEVVREAFAAVRGPLYDRLLAKMSR